MKPIKVQKYQANDGSLFDSESEAVHYEQVELLARNLASEGPYLSYDIAREVAEYIVKHYAITPYSELP